jgi:penicillin-binding protein 1B
LTSPISPVPALALGSFEVTPLELATAYATLANGGTLVRAHAVRAVEGRAVSPASRGVLRLLPEEAYVVTYLLRGVVDRGTGAAVRALGLGGALAGKTGTTNDTRDAWFAGYSPRLVAVVWIGFDDGAPLRLSGAQGALPIWADLMRAARSLEESGEFTVPPTVAFSHVCGNPVPDAFLPSTERPERCGLMAHPAPPIGAPGDRPLVAPPSDR